jgi:diguanylate cyclase (GGDEF)-like protein
MTWIANGVCVLFLLLTLFLLWQQWSAYTQAMRASAAFRIFRSTLVAMEKVSAERWPSNSVLGERLPIPAERLEAMRRARAESDATLNDLLMQLDTASADCSWCADEQETVEGARADLIVARGRVDELTGLPLAQRNSPDLTDTVDRLVSVIPHFTPLVYRSNMEVIKGDATALDPLQMARLAAMLREEAGLLGSRFTIALGRNRPLVYTEQLAIERSYGRIEQLRLLIEAGATYSPFLSPKNLAPMQRQYFVDGLAYVAAVRGLISAGAKDRPSTAVFADRYVPMVQPIVDFRDEMLATADKEVRRNRDTALDRFFRTAAGGIILIGLLLLLANVFRRQIMRPFIEAASAIGAIANSKFPEKIQSRPYQGEIQSLFDAVGVLKENGLARLRLEEERRQLMAELQAMAETDALTHLMNRRAFEKQARALRSGAPLSEGEDSIIALIVFDIDHFKKINDTYGHAIGDTALKALAEVCREIWRKQDIVARIGGEEFAVMMETRDPRDAIQSAQRFREKLAQTSLHDEQGTRFSMTASFGIAFSKRSQLPELGVLLKRADKLLYKAKENGRNRVEAEDGESALSS